MAALPSGTVTFFMTDIEGSTRLWDEHPQEMAVAVERHDALLAAAIAEQGGRIVKQRLAGDSFMAVFERASDAVAVAAAAQRALAAEAWPETTPVRVRMAIHTGEAEPRGEDYFGKTVNHCARLREVAHGGQTVLSHASHGLLADRPPDGVEVISLGRHVLRDLQLVEDVFQIVPAGLPAEFPPLKSVDAFPNNLQHVVSSFVGRHEEMEVGRELLATSRIVTLTGPGGSGKTRLALQLAAEMLERVPDGIWAIDLAPLGADADVARAVAAVKGVRELPDVDLTRSLYAHIGGGRELILLDNCEHLAVACARLAEALVRNCPNVILLTTSHEPLGVAGEHVYGVPEMSLPGPDTARATAASIAAYDAVALFVERAKEADHGFTVTDGDAPAVAELCRLLDGMPLALELAAPLVGTLSVPDMVQRLRDYPLRDLKSLDPTVEDRHRSVQRMIEWSVKLLSPREQAFFTRLAVFAEGFSMAAVESVCTNADVRADEVLDLMTVLIRKSLVSRMNEPAGVRYRLLWTLREFTRGRIDDAERADLTVRHAAHYARLAAGAGPGMAGPEQQMWHNVLTAESANIDLALDALLAAGRAEDALAMASSLWQHWFVRGRFGAGRAVLERCLSAFDDGTDPPPELHARALLGAGTLATYQGDHAAAKTLLERSRDLWQLLGDEMNEARALSSLASVHQRVNEYANAQAAWERCLEIVERAGQPMAAATVRYNLALILESRCELAEARVQAEACMDVFDRFGHRQGVALCMSLLGMISAKESDVAGFRKWFGESITRFDGLNDLHSSAEARMRLGYALFLNDESEEGERLLRLAHEALLRLDQKDDRLGQCLHHLASVAEANDDTARADALLRECARIADELDDHWLRSAALDGLGRLAVDEGRLADGRLMLQDSLRIRRARKLLMPMVESLDSLAVQADAERLHARAVQLCAAAQAQRTRHGLVMSPRQQRTVDSIRANALTALGPTGSSAAEHVGAAWSLDEACEAALGLALTPKSFGRDR